MSAVLINRQQKGGVMLKRRKFLIKESAEEKLVICEKCHSDEFKLLINEKGKLYAECCNCLKAFNT